MPFLPLLLSLTLGTGSPLPSRPIHTYSIVARDAATGELGVAVQSHWFSVGSSVPWAEAGVGAVATQSFTDPTYGAMGLALMRAGKSAPEALKALLAADPDREVRQVAMVDAQGRAAAFTGAKCIQAAGDEVGDGFTVEANLMDKPTVWPAMAKAFREAKGDLADRLLAALRAAQAQSGDIRGQQSAAILIVKGKASGQPRSAHGTEPSRPAAPGLHPHGSGRRLRDRRLVGRGQGGLRGRVEAGPRRVGDALLAGRGPGLRREAGRGPADLQAGLRRGTLLEAPGAPPRRRGPAAQGSRPPEGHRGPVARTVHRPGPGESRGLADGGGAAV